MPQHSTRRTTLLLRATAALALAFASDARSVAHAAGSDGRSRPHPDPHFTPGAAGLGDPYFPLDGNGGYDVEHYQLQLRYEPSSDRLTGLATVTARATQDLSSFNMDLEGLEIHALQVDGRPASFTRSGAELTVQPARGLRVQEVFELTLEYSGVPAPIVEPTIGVSGFMPTEDGALVIGEPHVAATWFPANDHPTDRASFTFEITVPEGLEVVANGALVSQRTRRGWTTWVWDAAAPMSTYLAGMAIGEYALSSYRRNHIRYWDAVAADFFEPLAAPSSGSRFAFSQVADSSYKRLARTVSVPDGGAQLSFDVTRDTEGGFDFFFVEAHTPGADDWTTLPDEAGHTSSETSFACPFWHTLHPFLAHYESAAAAPVEEGLPCVPSGTTGEWWGASGASVGAERWTVDLSRWAGRDVELVLSYVSDDVVQRGGVVLDDLVLSSGAGSSSFEEDGDVLDGWVVLGAPEGTSANSNDWGPAGVADLPPTVGEAINTTLARQPDIIAFLEEQFGPYPFDIAGAIATGESTGFALENQTRPVYPGYALTSPESGASLLIHELAHQWFGDSLTVAGWQHIWLNEGFATYAEWLWAEHEGLGTVQQTFESYLAFPAEDPFWSLTIGDPGPERLFDRAVYDRGALTLHALRQRVGDETFFEILQHYTCAQAGQTVTTEDFIAVAEALSGQDLGALFDAWLFSASRP